MENAWFFFALTGTTIGAVVQLIDIYLRKDGIFKSPLEPTIVSGIMQTMLWVTIPFVGFHLPADPWVTYVAVLGGMLYFCALYFYFRAVFTFGDITLVSILWNLLVLAVPVGAFFLLGETLEMKDYIGMSLLLFGSLSLKFSRGVDMRIVSRVASLMSVAVVLMALSLICMKYAYTHTEYWNGYLLYNFGIVGSAGLAYVLFLDKKSEKHLKSSLGKFLYFFIGIEFLQLIGEFFLNKAVSTGSVSLVSAVESTQAFFVILASIVGAFMTHIFFHKKEALALAVRSIQLKSFQVKIFAIMIGSIGAFIIST